MDVVVGRRECNSVCEINSSHVNDAERLAASHRLVERLGGLQAAIDYVPDVYD